MKEITDNDYRALELLREKMQTSARMIKLRDECRGDTSNYNFGEDPFAMGPVASKQRLAMKDRIERIEFALEAWAKGEDILVAMLADPREDKPQFLGHPHIQALRKAQAQYTQRMTNQSFGQQAATNAIASLSNAIAHFNKPKGA